MHTYINMLNVISLIFGSKREAIACDSVSSGRLQHATYSRHIRTRPIEIVNIIRLTDWPVHEKGPVRRIAQILLHKQEAQGIW